MTSFRPNRPRRLKKLCAHMVSVALFVAAVVPSLALAMKIPEPTAQAVQEIVDALRHCRTNDAARITDERSLLALQTWVEIARHANYSGEEDEYLSYLEQRALDHLRRHGPEATVADAFRSLCLSISGMHVALQHMHHEPALVHNRYAWIPLLDSNNDYFGLGFALIWERGRWLSALGQQADQRFIPRTIPGKKLTAAFDADLAYWSEFDDQIPTCPIRPPHSNPLWDANKSDTAYEKTYADSVLEEDVNANTIGFLQRRALERYALGLQTPVSAVALALHAEVVMHSAFFSNGPGVGSAGWREQIKRAVAMARRAESLGAPLSRLGPAIRFAGELRLSGQGAFAVDVTEGKALIDWAARLGDSDAIHRKAQFVAYGLLGETVDCGAAAALLEPFVADSVWNSVERTVLILSNCPDPAQRNSKRALAVLNEYVRRSGAAAWLDTRNEPARAAATCQQQRELAAAASQSPPFRCRNATPEYTPSGFLAELVQAKTNRGADALDDAYSWVPAGASEDRISGGSLDFSCDLPFP